MKPLQNVLALTDFSEYADRALARAAHLAAQRGAALEVLHVVSEQALDALRNFTPTAAADVAPALMNAAQQALQTACAELARASGVRASPRLRKGRILDEIVAVARDADLVVVGERGANPVRDALLGTTAERLLGRSSCPTLVVRRPANQDYRQVVVAADGSPEISMLLEAAAIVAPQAEVHVVHAADIPLDRRVRLSVVSEGDAQGYRLQEGGRALSVIQQAIAERPAGSRQHIVPVVGYGNAVQVLLDHEQAINAELMIIGKHSPPGIADFLLGSVARHVVADAGCDVLVIALEQAPPRD